MNSKNRVLEINGLNKSFNHRHVIKNLNINVYEGDIYGFLGQNGEGKTTTIKLITGLIFSDSGEIKISGNSVNKDFVQAISSLGAIIENPSFYNYLSGYDNLKLMANLIPVLKTKKERTNRIEQVLETVGLSERKKDKVKTYSLGMKQRLGIAHAMLGYPKLIILDEPTNGLDPQGMEDIKKLILKLSKEEKITFFISSHLLHEMEQLCTRVGIIKSGTLIKEGYIEELVDNRYEKAIIQTTNNGNTKKILKNLSFVIDVKEETQGIHITIEKNSMSKINRKLIENDIDIISTTQVKQTLEDIYFATTK